MEIYCEYSVVNREIDRHKKRNIVLRIGKYASVALFIFSLFMLGFLNVPQSAAEILPTILIAVAWIGLPMGAFFIFRYFQNRSNIEYDYFIINDLFRIVQVINRRKRKKFLEASISSFDSIGAVESEAYDRLAGNKDTKKLYAMCNYDSDGLIYVYFTHKGFKTLLFLETNDEMMVALRKAVKRITVLDASLKNMKKPDPTPTNRETSTYTGLSSENKDVPSGSDRKKP